MTYQDQALNGDGIPVVPFKSLTQGSVGEHKTLTRNAPLPRHVRVSTRADGAKRFIHYVEPSQRPAGWGAPSRRLPFSEPRLGSLSDPDFYDRVARDAGILTARLDRMREREEGAPPTAPAGTVPAAIALYKSLSRYKDVKRKANIDCTLRKIARWSFELGHPHMSEIEFEALDELVATQRYSQKIQVRTYLNVLYNIALIKKWVAANPIEFIKCSNPKPLTRERLWTESDLAAYQAAARNIGYPSVAVALDIMWNTSLRVNDVCTLRHGFEYIPGSLRVVLSKTSENVVTPISRQLDEVIQGVRKEDCHFVIRNDRTGKAFATRNSFYRVFLRVKSHAMVYLGQRALNARALRHTAICRMHNSGSDPFEIASLTGHDPVSVMATIKSYMIDFDNLARATALRLHVAGGGSSDDFSEADPHDTRWQTKRRPDDFKPDLLTTPLGSAGGREAGVESEGSAQTEPAAGELKGQGSESTVARARVRYRKPSPEVIASALGLKVRGTSDPT